MPEEFREHCEQHSGNMACISNLKTRSDKFEEDIGAVLEEMKKKVNWQMFIWVVGGIALAYLSIAGLQMSFSLQNSKDVAELKGIVMAQGAELKSKIETQMATMDRLISIAANNASRIGVLEGKLEAYHEREGGDRK